MSYYVSYKLRCTQCNRYDFEEVGETVREVRQYAKNAGWRYSKVQNGSYWDFCPKCWEKYTNEQDADG